MTAGLGGAVPRRKGMAINDEQLARAIDNFSDAERFAREAKRAVELGHVAEAERFAELARKAVEDGVYELGGTS